MFAVQVTDNSPVPQTATQALSLTIGDQLTITTSSLPPAVFGATYNYPLSATGGTAPYRWTLISGTLPPGLSLSLAGYIVGTCTGSGVFTITVQATDSTSPTAQSATRVLTVDSNTSLSITSGPLPPAQLGQGYTSSLTAAGGVPPYTWSILGSPLPSGLSLSTTGTISGAPTTAGTTSVSFQVADSAGNTTNRTFLPHCVITAQYQHGQSFTRYDRLRIRHHAQRHRGDYALFMERHQWQSPGRRYAVQLRTSLWQPEHCRHSLIHCSGDRQHPTNSANCNEDPLYRGHQPALHHIHRSSERDHRHCLLAVVGRNGRHHALHLDRHQWNHPERL